MLQQNYFYDVELININYLITFSCVEKLKNVVLACEKIAECPSLKESEEEIIDSDNEDEEVDFQNFKFNDDLENKSLIEESDETTKAVLPDLAIAIEHSGVNRK